MDAPELLCTVDEGIATLTLNRPRRFNALSAALLTTLGNELDRLAADESVRVVIITGAGKAFCAGHDLLELSALPAEEALRLFGSCSTVMQKLVALPQPVIAAVNGIATAAGCQLVAQCDLAVAADNARFAVSGVNLGLFCSTPAVALSRNIGRKHAVEMLFTGDFIDAEQAADWGLVNRVVPAERLMESTRELANNIKSKPREALALGKALFYRQLESTLSAAYADASRTIAGNAALPFARAGVADFLSRK